MRVAWALLLLLQLAMFAACTCVAWQRPDLEWVSWVAAGGALPMLVMRRMLPPSLWAADPRLLFGLSLALLLVGGVIFAGLESVVGNTLFVTLGAVSLGLGLWLSALGMQGRPNRRERHAVLSPALEGRYLLALVRRPVVVQALLTVFLTGAGVWYAASMWPRITEGGPGIERSGSEALWAVSFFWLGVLVGAVPALARWEQSKPALGRVVSASALALAALMAALASLWPGVIAALPPLVLGYAWARTLRRAAETLREEIPNSLEIRLPVWLLTVSGWAAVLGALLSFSLSRSPVSESAGIAWLKGPFPAVLFLLAAAAVAALKRTAKVAATTGDTENATVVEGSATVAKPNPTERWVDFPAFELKRPVTEVDDGRVVEIAYDVPEENLASFLEAMREMERVRVEEGAVWWTLTRNSEHSTVYHEFFRIESWTERQTALRDEDGRARSLKLQAFSANDWESLPAEIHYQLFDLARDKVLAKDPGVEDSADDGSVGG